MRSIPINLWIRHMVLLCAGCGVADRGPTLIPVSGMVSIAGKPAERGSVAFHEESSNTGHTPIGMISPDGTYQLYVNGKPGAMPGSYKVTLFIHEPAQPGAGHAGLPKSRIDPKYSHQDQTPFLINVRENAAPDAYNLAIP